MTNHAETFNFKSGKWINAPFAALDDIDHTELLTSRGAPWVRTTFESSTNKNAKLYFSAPGWCEIYINGYRINKTVLTPVVTQLTARTGYLCVDVSKYLKSGKNAVAVLLGNGWFNCQTKENWEFQLAPWRAEPILLLSIEDENGNILTASNKTWKGAPSFITMNSLRNGEFQDTRIGLEPDFVSDPDFDDSDWENVFIANPPSGTLTLEDCEQCIIAEQFQPVKKSWLNAYCFVYDFGKNLSGWCELEAEGVSGSEIIVEYGEKLRANGDLDTEEIKIFVKSGNFQTDKYILNGKGIQHLRPHFTYHGFRYVRITTSPRVEIHNITADFIHNDFSQLGNFVTTNKELTWLQNAITHSYLCNYTGIPTDCPHREKNGWTGDANLALESGLWNFDVRKAAIHFGRMLMDAQRPSGQLPGIVPTGGWGYNYGPAWDGYIFEAAYQLWMFYCDDTLIREQYDNMSKYISFCLWKEDDGVLNYGLWDWCAYDESHVPETSLTSTGFYHQTIQRMEEFAEIIGRNDDIRKWQSLKEKVKTNFIKKFIQNDGGCGNNSVTALATALFFKLTPKPDATMNKLLDLLQMNEYIADFGILGAKMTGRVLGEMGRLEELFKLFTQPRFPGWIHWMNQGATTLWENWNGRESQTHVMYGDPSACFFRYFAGIRPTAPGFSKVEICPAVNVSGLSDFNCHYQTPHGIITSQLSTNNGQRKYTCKIPENMEVLLKLPGQSPMIINQENNDRSYSV